MRIASEAQFRALPNREVSATEAGGPGTALGTWVGGEAKAAGGIEATSKRAEPEKDWTPQRSGVAAPASRNPSLQPSGGLPVPLQGTAEEVPGAASAAGRIGGQWADGGQAVPSHDANPALGTSLKAKPVSSGAVVEGPSQLPVAGLAAVLPSSPGPADPFGLENAALENTGRSNSRTASLQGTGQEMRGHNAGSSPSAHRATPVMAQPAVVSADAAGLARDPAGTPPANVLEGTRESVTGGELKETFAALDSGAAPGPPTWTHAGGRQAEAGFRDPALGWVGVRAEMSGGGVHAALVPGSPEAAQELGRQMEGLHTYLAARHPSVESLALATPGGRSGGFSGGESMSQQAQQNMQQGTGQGSGQQTYSDAEPRLLPIEVRSDRPVAAESSVAAAGVSSGAPMEAAKGSRISVMA